MEEEIVMSEDEENLLEEIHGERKSADIKALNKKGKISRVELDELFNST